MIRNNKPHVFSTGSDNPADGESVSAANYTQHTRQASKYIYRSRDSLPFITTDQLSDDGFMAGKLAATDHLKRSGLTPVWSDDDLKRERKILVDQYINLIYDIEVANV
jgi:hypothetical protein